MIAKEEIASKESQISELNSVNQILKDEYHTINLTVNSLEEKYRVAQVRYLFIYYLLYIY